MKRSSSGTGADAAVPERTGWLRRFCRKGFFREVWRSRFVALRGTQLLISEKEVKDASRADELLDLSDYERCEEVRKNKSRSKKNLSKFRLQRCSAPGNTAPNVIFLAVSPEEKESWINALNAAITRARNRVLDEVPVEDAQLSHLTRDRVKIPHSRRLPTRGHLLAVASSSSDGMLTLDLVQEQDDAPVAVDSPRQEAQPEKSRRASSEQILTQPDTKAVKNGATVGTATPVNRLQELIGLKLQETEQLLMEVKEAKGKEAKGKEAKGKESTEATRTEAERLLKEAAAAWSQAQEVLQEVKELRGLCQQLASTSPNTCPSTSPNTSSNTSSNTSTRHPDRKSPM